MIESLINIFKESVVRDWQWALVALTANFVFALRFPLQWIMSELKGKSYIPLPFWFISILGSVIMFVYAVHIQNFMVMLSAFLPVSIYLRNIQLTKNERIKSDSRGKSKIL